ncbi:TetR family transcriptional regulator [Microbacterium sp. NPDC077644]|uniref:TetR/AcrR family transcriptional regulator n=1 Tax=Microbacterium sp. NPDC077644 TaxID=3155055 RepID=UPI003450B9AE
MSTRTRALNAAIDVVGHDGVRALTHARVDAAAGLPRGSTSNHFRTRAALVAGVIAHLAEQERADGGNPRIRTEDELIAALIAMIEAQSGLLATRTRARYALFLEADPDAAAPMHEQRAAFEEWTSGILSSLGGPAAAERTPFLMASCEGLLLHRLTVDPGAPVAASIALAVRTAVHDNTGAPQDNQPPQG